MNKTIAFVDHVLIKARAGATVNDVLREALLYCILNDVEVKVVHNDRVWHFTPTAVLAMIHTQQKGEL